MIIDIPISQSNLKNFTEIEENHSKIFFFEWRICLSHSFVLLHFCREAYWHHISHSPEISKKANSPGELIAPDHPTQTSFTKKLSKVANPPEALPDSPLDNVNLNHADWDGVRKELSTINWTEYLKDKNIDDTNMFIIKSLTDACC